VIGGIAMNATQMLVIAIIMPTIVRDVGGASFYTWAAMLYTIGSIVGTAFGAAIAGVVANIAGLGAATDPVAVGHAVTAVYQFCVIPFGIAALLMSRFIRIAVARPETVPAPDVVQVCEKAGRSERI
jgi:hypothetical protein